MASFRLINETPRDDDEVRRIADFVFDRCGGIRSHTTIRLKADGRLGGYASDRQRHRFPKWAGRSRFAIKASVWPDKSSLYRKPRLCGHATSYPMTEALEDRYGRGGRRWGRWPIYEVRDWREALVHLLAHEFFHVIQYDRDRGSYSEVDCEVFAEDMLESWRSAILQVEGEGQREKGQP